MVAMSGTGWRLAPSLVTLIKEVDARYPGRTKTYDGSIGDQAHAARSSEHNPDRDSDPMPNGLVSALDITKDSAAMAKVILDNTIRDPRVWYVIHDGYIYSRTHGWAKRSYDGNPHTHHVHVSLVQSSAAASSTATWSIKTPAAVKPAATKPAAAPVAKPVALDPDVKAGAWHPQVKLLKKFLDAAGYRGSVKPYDGYYGSGCRAAVAAFHKDNPEYSSRPDGRDEHIGAKGFLALQKMGRS